MPLVIQIFDYNWQLMIRTTILDMSRSWTQDTGITWSMNRPPKLVDSQFRDLKLILSSRWSPRPRFYHVYESPCNRINSFPIRQVRRQISNSFLSYLRKSLESRRRSISSRLRCLSGVLGEESEKLFLPSRPWYYRGCISPLSFKPFFMLAYWW